METILCGMNEVDSNKIQKETEKLGEVKASGMTGFEEKFKVFIHSTWFNFKQAKMKDESIKLTCTTEK